MARHRSDPEHADESAADRQRAIQAGIDAKDAAKGGGDEREKPAVQAGDRPQPESMPAQHLKKPGNEHELELEPRFLAPG